MYRNPFVDAAKFWKSGLNGDCIYYMYKDGLRYSGDLADTIVLNNRGDTLLFIAQCLNGMVQGMGLLIRLPSNRPIAQCYFENGEIVGDCLSWNMNNGETTKVTFVKGDCQWLAYMMFDKEGKLIMKRER